MKKFAMAIAASSLLVVSSAQADGREFGQIYTDCGLGGLIGSTVNDESTGNVLAVITNITWDLGTTAISSNISSPDTCSNNKAKTAAFIFETYPQLEANLATGEGEHLAALMNITGCDTATQALVVEGLRSDLANSVASKSYAAQTREEKSADLHTSLSARTSSCSI